MTDAPLHDHWASRVENRRQYLRGVYRWGERGHLLFPVTYCVDPRNDYWPADEYDINIMDSRVLVVCQKGDRVPVKFYNADLWQLIHQYVKPERMGRYRRPARLLLLTQEQIDRWDPIKGEVTPHPVAPDQ